ncbi:MAG: hypothetical protein G01um101493_104, partial [Microgenomates group bacterium Gr01-1014_93]
HPVVHRDSNQFTLCIPEHIQRDKLEIAAFLGENRDPETLVAFLMDHYPITRNRKYFDLQVGCIMTTNFHFIEVANNLNGELPEVIKDKFRRAAVLAGDFNSRLTHMSPPPFIFGTEFLNSPRLVLVGETVA